MKTLSYVLPFYFKVAPNPSVMMCIELRPIRFARKNGQDVNVEQDKLVSLYSDSMYHPIHEFKEQKGRYGITIDDAKTFLKSLGAIAVKDEFSQYDIDDLREIKHLLPANWIEGFNSRMAVDYDKNFQL